MKKVEAFLEASAKLGYKLEGSVFKVDYNGSTYTVGFWIRPVYNFKTGKFKLNGRCGKAKHTDFNKAVDLAIEKALEMEKG